MLYRLSCQYFKFFNISEICHSNTNGLMYQAGIFILELNFAAFCCMSTCLVIVVPTQSFWFFFQHLSLTSFVQMILLTSSITSSKSPGVKSKLKYNLLFCLFKVYNLIWWPSPLRSSLLAKARSKPTFYVGSSAM